MTVETIIGIAGVLTALTVIIVFSAKSLKVVKRIFHFIDDFLGEEARPGVPARPGFSERMTHIESTINNIGTRIDEIEIKIERIEKELKPNAGSTLKDAITRIENRLNNLEDDDAIRNRD